MKFTLIGDNNWKKIGSIYCSQEDQSIVWRRNYFWYDQHSVTRVCGRLHGSWDGPCVDELTFWTRHWPPSRRGRRCCCWCLTPRSELATRPGHRSACKQNRMLSWTSCSLSGQQNRLVGWLVGLVEKCFYLISCPKSLLLCEADFVAEDACARFVCVCLFLIQPHDTALNDVFGWQESKDYTIFC